MFDNQGDAGYPSVQRGVLSGSRVLEIDPIKKEIVWQYTASNSAQPDWAFFSSFISSARRLPNGNTPSLMKVKMVVSFRLHHKENRLGICQSLYWSSP